MQLVRYAIEGRQELGTLVPGGIVDLGDVGLPIDMVELIGLGDDGLDAVRVAVQDGSPISLDDAALLAPIPRPPPWNRKRSTESPGVSISCQTKS